jgi:hypothetical protein
VFHIFCWTPGVYQGMALAAALERQGLKPGFKITPFSARLKPCPDTRPSHPQRNRNLELTPGVQPKIWVKTSLGERGRG